MKRVWPLALTAFCLMLFFAFNGAYAEEDKRFQPLFPIALGHDFPDAEKTFNQAKDLILSKYYTEGITEEALYWAAIKGMLRHISPPQNPELAQIWTAPQYQKVLESLTGVKVSLGFTASFNASKGSLEVEEVTAGSPAAGILLPLDRILRINKTPIKGRSAAQVQKMLAGREGDQILLTVNRDIKIFDVALTHEKVEEENLIVAPLDNTVALVEIRNFTTGLAKKLKSRLEEMETIGIRRLIIDLRNNPGGIFIQALKCADLFIPEKGVLLQTLQRDAQKTNYISSNKKPFSFEIIILVNDKTASSAEILAASLRDNGRAVIVGCRTHGKGVFETTFTLDNGCRVKFITGAMYSPRLYSWQGRGVTPDFLVEQTQDQLAAIRKQPPVTRLQTDVAVITAHKLLVR